MRATLTRLLLAMHMAFATSESYDGPYTQPRWERRDEQNSKVHSMMEEAAILHQDGELEKAVQMQPAESEVTRAAPYKQVIKLSPNGEAYATLSKVLADQGKYDLSDKAMNKATRIHNEQLASWSLF